MPDEEKKKQLWISALRLLAASPKSRKELERKLEGKGFSEALIREAVEKLEDQGFLNDRRFARDIVQRYRMVKPSGRRKIEFELRRRSIAPSLCQEVLAEVLPEDESRAAEELAASQWLRHAKLPLLKRKKKIYDFLARRGYAFDICRDALEKLAARNEQEIE